MSLFRSQNSFDDAKRIIFFQKNSVLAKLIVRINGSNLLCTD
jgi:hypothetical protein